MRPPSFRTCARVAPYGCGLLIFLVAACRAFSASDAGIMQFEAPDIATLDPEANESSPIIDAEAERYEERPSIEEPDELQSDDPKSSDKKRAFKTPSSPDEVFDSSQQGQMVTIDGADVGPAKVEEPREDDPFPNGFSVRWLMPVDGFGITDLETSQVDHRPRFSETTRININVPFAVHFVDEPQALGLPSELYNAQIETRLVQRINDAFGFDVSVIPGWFSDFDSGRNNGFRVTGHGMLTLTLSDELKLAIGAMYLGRDDVHVLPAGGIVTRIFPDTQLELVMPKPRIVQHIATHDKWDQFVYAAFELWGGDTWAVTRPDFSYDRFTYSDFRFLVGHELRGPSAFTNVFELGYVFARKLEFRNSPETLEPGGTLLLRIASSY